MKEDSGELNKIVKDSFERLKQLMNVMFDNQVDSYVQQDALYIIYDISLIFFKCNRLQICPYLKQIHIIDSWIACFKLILDMVCPVGLQTVTEDKSEMDRRENSIFWKVKGIVAKSTYWFIIKYGDASNAEDEESKEFGTNFSDFYSNSLIDSHIKILLATKLSYVGRKCLKYSLRIITEACNIPPLMELMKHNVN